MKVMMVFGTRPEAIKMAPIILELKKRPQIKPIVVLTGQHREMLDQVLRLFNINVDYDLNVMTHGQELHEITEKVMRGLDGILKNVMPDIVIVHGDTTTTFATSLTAYYNQIPVAHVEAGLRTYNKYSPFPEELNRQLTGVIADYHFAPTINAADNLIKEGKKRSAIYVTGNTVIDALKTTVTPDYHHPIIDSVAKKQRKLIMLTTHRRENLGEPMKNIFRAILKLVKNHPDIEVVFPVHLNPRIKEISQEILGGNERIHLIEPLEVYDFHNFMAKSYLILTDSGGVQEEAPSLGVPVLVLRDTTERPEGLEAGTLKLIGVKEMDIYNHVENLLNDKVEYHKMSQVSNPFGDGYASNRIVDILTHEANVDDGYRKK